MKTTNKHQRAAERISHLREDAILLERELVARVQKYAEKGAPGLRKEIERAYAEIERASRRLAVAAARET